MNQSAPNEIIEFYSEKDQVYKMQRVITHANGHVLECVEEKDRVYFKVEKVPENG